MQPVVVSLISMLAMALFGQRSGLQPIARADLDVTDGKIESSKGRLLIDGPSARAVVRAPAQAIEVRFTYLGPTGTTVPLASGEVRRQFGLKLKAQDPCNLLYVMWREAPQSSLVVSMKHNPGMQSSSQCRDGGYRTLKPVKWGPPPALQPGSAHALSASIDKDALRVRVDGELLWEGRVPAEAMSFGPVVGIRSDNVRVAFDVLTPR